MENTCNNSLISVDDENGFSSDSSDADEQIEFEELEFPGEDQRSETEETEGPYSEEPLANEEWLEEYNRERRMIEERQEELEDRLGRVVEVGTS